MIDPVQAVLLFVIILLTILLIILGIQVFFILRDFRKTLFHINEVLEDTETITRSVSEPVSMASEALQGSSALVALLRLFTSHKKKK